MTFLANINDYLNAGADTGIDSGVMDPFQRSLYSWYSDDEVIKAINKDDNNSECGNMIGRKLFDFENYRVRIGW